MLGIDMVERPNKKKINKMTAEELTKFIAYLIEKGNKNSKVYEHAVQHLKVKDGDVA